MKSFRLIAPLFLSAIYAFAAGPPRGAEKALRARVQEFYQLLVQNKARAAEALVASDSKDFYYNSHKPEIESFDIGDIAWGSGYKTAVVTILAKVQVVFPGAGPHPVQAKVPSDWKIDRGKWCWYANEARLANSPFGQFHAGPPATGQPGPTAPGRSGQVVSKEMLHAGVKPDRNQISVDVHGNIPATLTFTNSLPGPAVLHAPNVPGLKIEIAKPTLGAGESTSVTFAYDGANRSPSPVTAMFTIEPTSQQIPIQVIFAANNR